MTKKRITPKEKHTVHYCKPNSSSPEYHKTHPIMIDDVRTNKIDIWYALADGTFLNIRMKVDNKKYKSKELTPKAKKSGVRSQLHMDIYDELPDNVKYKKYHFMFFGKLHYQLYPSGRIKGLA